MSCNDYEEQINLLIDGELEEFRQAALYSHLEQCAECRALFTGILRVRQLLQKDAPLFPDELDSKVVSQVAGAGQDPHAAVDRRLRVPLPIAAAAMILLAAAAFFIGRSHKSQPPAQMQETRTALVSTQPKIEILYGLPAVEVVGYATKVPNPDSGKTIVH